MSEKDKPNEHTSDHQNTSGRQKDPYQKSQLEEMDEAKSSMKTEQPEESVVEETFAQGEEEVEEPSNPWLPERLRNVPVEMEVLFGSTEMRLKDVLAFEPEQVVELVERIEEPLYLYANKTLVAKGLLKDCDGYVGFEITELVEEKPVS